MKRVYADQKEAIVFLAKIIPKEDKERIRRKLEKHPDLLPMFLGMKVLNALRIGGFFYGPHTMDFIWFGWLKEAVSLPEDRIILTDSVRRRIKEFREYASPPVSPKLDMEQINRIKERLENLYGIEMPTVEVEYSEDVKGSLTSAPLTFNLDELEYVARERDHIFRWIGLKEQEISRIDSSTYTIFLLTRHPKQQIGLYGSAWHELAHVAAYVIGIKDAVIGESFAFANEFKGLLEAAEDGLFPRDKVIDSIEFCIKQAKYEKLDSAIFSQMRRAKGKVPIYLATAVHYQALDHLKRYNPDLSYQGRNLDELIAELDNSTQYIMNLWRRKKWMSTARRALPSVMVIASFIIFFLWKLSLQK